MNRNISASSVTDRQYYRHDHKVERVPLPGLQHRQTKRQAVLHVVPVDFFEKVFLVPFFNFWWRACHGCGKS